MELTLDRIGDSVVARPIGDIDHATADTFKESLLPALESSKGSRFVLDLQDVAYMSSVGLRVIMIAVKQAKADGTEMVAAGLNETLTEIFQITRFDKILDIFPSVDAALAAE